MYKRMAGVAHSENLILHKIVFGSIFQADLMSWKDVST